MTLGLETWNTDFNTDCSVSCFKSEMKSLVKYIYNTNPMFNFIMSNLTSLNMIPNLTVVFNTYPMRNFTMITKLTIVPTSPKPNIPINTNLTMVLNLTIVFNINKDRWERLGSSL